MLLCTINHYIMKRSIFLFFILLATSAIYSQGNLLISPTRVVFENGKQKDDLNLTNIGRDTAVYLISFLHYQMLSDGSFKQMEKPDSLLCADNYLRIFPRKIILPPNESQIIRLQFRKPANMKEKEYRSHLYFRAEKENSPLGLKNQKLDSTKMAVRITPVFGISIPVIIRNGNLDAKVEISEIAAKTLNDSTTQIKFAINRSGNKSVYGNLTVDYVPEKGKPIQIGVANGVGIYTEIDKRTFQMTLNWPKTIKQHAGKLIIYYKMPKEEGNNELTHEEYMLQ